ncbi:dihydrolipoyl dehydrogenase [Clostridium sp. Marseille-P2415]|uniref:dihydrolipoyl dehydrogenase n=1 Tax=Clostridium sp. Marseille-P2415 TaxID=1805471 RepID=UPI00098862DE|nr:dihydrolipoyl dehydrogenase [Clostridium sp. Marseille-P2415]
MALHYDIIVVGGGPGGYTAALKAAGLGLKTALVEKQKLGGTCVNKGCIPTKSLLHASSIFEALRNSDEFGVSTDFISFDFKKMQNYKKRSVKAYRNEVKELVAASGVTVIYGTATIRRGHTIEVNGPEGKDYYEADHIIIATGARPVTLKIPGADLPGVLTSDRLLASDTWNYDRLTIIGGGVIGVEFATVFNALCSHVTILESKEHLLGPMDSEVSQALQEELSRKGITIYCNTRVKEIREELNQGLVCVFEVNGEEQAIRSGQVLMAAGRTPCMEGLIGQDVELEMENGHMKVDSEFSTSEPGIYAIGDVVADKKLAHVAAAQGTYVVEKIAGVQHTIRLSVVPNGMFVKLPVVPSCIYTEPEIASVGITREAAIACSMKVCCGRYSMSGNGKSIITKEQSGFIHLVFEEYSGTLVGAQIVCSRATDMISEMATAIANGLTAEQLMLAMRAHPTYSEGITAAIENYFETKGEIKQ